MNYDTRTSSQRLNKSVAKKRDWQVKEIFAGISLFVGGYAFTVLYLALTNAQ